MPTHPSPLRYPGGKHSIAPFLREVLIENDLHDGLLVEPFAGGAGASLRLLFDEVVSELILNDADPRIYAFWRAVLNQTDELVDRIESTPATMDQWKACRKIYDSSVSRQSQIDVAFAVFFLNRCNRSGILMGGGPIGGYEQSGTWRLDARYNRTDLVSRIRRVAEYRDRIKVTKLDARALLASLPSNKPRQLVFLDPPYYEKGQRLYLNSLDANDHQELSKALLTSPSYRWVMTYDNVEQIRALYQGVKQLPFELNYSAHSRRSGREVMIFDPRLRVPNQGVLH